MLRVGRRECRCGQGIQNKHVFIKTCPSPNEFFEDKTLTDFKTLHNAMSLLPDSENIILYSVYTLIIDIALYTIWIQVRSINKPTNWVDVLSNQVK